MSIVQWLTERDWAVIVAVIFATLRYAESLAVVTKTDADNKLIASIKEFFRFG